MALISTTPESTHPTNINWSKHVWFAVIFLIYVVDNADRYMISAVLPAIKAEFSLSDAKAGLIGGMLPLGICLLAIPSGIVVDRIGGRYAVSGMVALWSALTAITGIVRSFPMLLLMRAGVGVGEAGYTPAAYSLIAAWYPRNIRATMVGIFALGSPVGAAVGIGLAGYITFHYNWRHVFGIMAAPGLLLAMIFLFSPNSDTNSTDAKAKEPIWPRLIENIRFIAGTRALLMFLLIQLFLYIYVGAANVWGTVFLMRALGLNVAQASRFVVLVVIVGAIGVFVGGILSDGLTRRFALGRIYSVVISLTMLAVFGSAYYLRAGTGTSAYLVVALACATQFWQGTIWASLTSAPLDLLPAQFRGKSMSLQPLFQGLASFVAPPLVGAISDVWNLSAALLLVLAFSIASCAVLVWRAQQSYEAELLLQNANGPATMPG